MANLSLGSFALVKPLGRGGMGEVWEGRHELSGRSVAIKVMTGAAAQRAEYQDAFANEVRAVARLCHPHIIGVYDYGTVSEAEAMLAGGHLPFGSPYLAMEVARGGSLSDHRGRLGWEELHGVLGRLFDALGHAHARGIVHRDIKLGNVLLAGGLEQLRLTDFGLASVADPYEQASEDDVLHAGTPRYMAPEQITGRWRDFGPWTDLYAMGVVAFALASGQVPFDSEDRQRVFGMHLFDAVPSLPSWSPGPRGLCDWIRRLMAKDHRQRFQSAAEAKAELQALVDWNRRLRIPVSWRTAERVASRWHLAGAGLGLFGLREVPLVGRDRERDALWRAFHDTASQGTSGVVVLRGSAGTGKSRLASWLAELAHERVGATTLRAVHSRMPGPGDGIGAMLGRHLQCRGLARGDLDVRLAGFVEGEGHERDYAVAALAEVAAPDDVPRVRFASVEERQRVVLGQLARLAGQRPLVLLLDDVQWGPDAFALASVLLDLRLPVLAILTVQDEALAERPDEDRALSLLTSLPRVRQLRVGPLPAVERRTLVEALLGLEGPLVEAIVERTAGNPLFAVQLVEDWVMRGLLEVGEAGFTLQEGARIELPADLHEVWAGALSRLLGGHPPDDAVALEIAAVLGSRPDTEEWREACAQCWVTPSPDLVDILQRRHLVRPSETGFEFVHGMLRESLERAARAAGRLGAHHLACAGMLAVKRGPGAHERRALHLVDAGLPLDALGPFLDAAREHTDSGDAEGARALLAQRERVMYRQRLPATDRRWADGRHFACELEAAIGTPQLQDHAGRVLLQLARSQQWKDTEALGLIAVASARRQAGLTEEGRELAQQALKLAQGEPDDDIYAKALWEVALDQAARGQLEGAISNLTVAAACAETGSSEATRAGILLALANARLGADQVDAAEQDLDRATAMFERLGLRMAQAGCWNARGELLRRRGALTEAVAAYRRAVDGYAGTAQAHLSWLHVAIVLAECGDFEGARPILERTLKALQELSWAAQVGVAHCMLLSCAAHDGDWRAWDLHARGAEQCLVETGMVDRDVLRGARRAAWMARQRGQAERATAIEAIARYQEVELLS